MLILALRSCQTYFGHILVKHWYSANGLAVPWTALHRLYTPSLLVLWAGADGWLSRSRAGAKVAAFAPARLLFQALIAVPRPAVKTISEQYSCFDSRDTCDVDKNVGHIKLDSFSRAAAVEGL